MSFKCSHLATALMLSSVALSNAHALVVISSGNTPGGDNVLFNNNPPNGTTVTGILNTNNNFNVNFESTQVLLGNGGQARVEAVNGNDLNNICVFLDPGLGFTQYVGNPFDATRNSTLTITVQSVDQFGNIEPQTIGMLSVGNGQNFFTVQALNGELITKIRLTGTDFQDLRQNRIVGAQFLPIPSSNVPEPGSVALLIGMATVCSIALRRKRK